MGSFTLYIIEWAFGLILMLVVYKLLCSGTTFHRFNRMILLSILGVSALFPTLHVEMGNNPITIHNSQFAQRIQQVDTLTLTNQGLVFLETEKAQETPTITPLSDTDYWPLLLVGIYIGYLTFIFIGWIRSTLKMINFLHRCRSRRIGRWIRLYVHNLPYGPFSWMNCIVLSESEKRYSHNIAMLHELAHVRQLHFIDLIIANFCSLINPICWLLLNELKTLHEYEADTQVLKCKYISPNNYQLQLIRLSVGNQAYTLASTLNFNLKKRIGMMKKQHSNPWRKACAILLFPTAVFAVMACGKTDKQHTDNEFSIVGTWIVKSATWDEQHSEYLLSDQYRRYKFILPDNTFYVTELLADSNRIINYAHCAGTYEYKDGKYIEHYTHTNAPSLDLQLQIIDADNYTTVFQGMTETWVRAIELTPEQESIIINDIKQQLNVDSEKTREALNTAIKSNSQINQKP